MKVVYTSNAKQVSDLFKRNIQQGLDAAQKPVVQSIKEETPVRTGVLKEGTQSKQERFDRVLVENDIEYAPYVELGTYKQAANPFFKRGLFKSLNTFLETFVSYLKRF